MFIPAMLCQATTCSQGKKVPLGYNHGSYAMFKAMPPGSNSMMRCVICKIRGVLYLCKIQYAIFMYICTYICICIWGLFLSVDRLRLQHLVCRCIVFHRSLLLKNLQETQSLKSRRSSLAWLLNEFATLSFSGIQRFLGLFLHESVKTHSKSWSTEWYARVFQSRLSHFAK